MIFLLKTIADNKNKNNQRAVKRACSALVESDSSDESAPISRCQLFQTTNKALVPLYALKNATQSSIIADFEFEKAMETTCEGDGDEPLSIRVLRSLLQQNARHTLELVTSEEHMAMTTIPDGRFIVHDVRNDDWFAIRRSSQRQPAVLLNASLDSMSDTWSFGETLSEDHYLYEIKELEPQFKRLCSTPAKTAPQLDETTELLSQTSIIDQQSAAESDDERPENESDDERRDNESDDESSEPPDFESDVQQEEGDQPDDFDMLISQLKLLQCVYCRELVSSKRHCEAKSFRCTKCSVIFKKDKINFWETEAGNPGPLPDILKNNPLSFVEEQLISLVCVNQYIYNRRTGVIASKGHCIHFMQDISLVSRVLPRLPAEVPIVIIQKRNWQGETTRDLKVRRAVVKLWLEFLKANNRLRAYRTLQIDEDRLNLLPVDDILPEIQIIETDNELETVATFERDSLQEERPDTDDANPAFDSGVTVLPSVVSSEQVQLEETVASILAGKRI